MTLTPAQLATLCTAALPEERLTTEELAHVCYGDGDEVHGDETGAIAYTTKQFGDLTAVWILLVAVHPDEQGRGRGKQLVASAIEAAQARGARSINLGNAVPRYLWPGLELTNTRAGMLFETMGFAGDLVGINMRIPSSMRAPVPAGVVVEQETSRGAVEFAARAYPYWIDELEVAIARGTAFAARDETGATIGFGCHSCNRAAWIGPMATDPDAQHGGIGSAVLSALCADLDARGYDAGEISWVSNLRFYGKNGATVSRVFQGGNRQL